MIIQWIEIWRLKGEGKRFLHDILICIYTLLEYISNIFVDCLCIVSVNLILKSHPSLLIHCQLMHTLKTSTGSSSERLINRWNRLPDSVDFNSLIRFT